METKFYTNYTEETFLNKIKSALRECREFYWSVSFIKMSGLQSFKNELETALEKGKKGCLITSTYQNFTDIPSLNYFLKLQEKYPNFTVNLDYHSFKDGGFHSKGYIFIKNNSVEAIIGSSNITRYALLKNVEWDLGVKISRDHNIVFKLLGEFKYLQEKTLILNKDIIEQYENELSYAIEKWDMDYYQGKSSIYPNLMQKKALKELRRYRDMNVNKALIVAATGSGKTYLAAFDAKNFNPSRLLFVVHRESILCDAMETFKKVFRDEVSYGLFSGKKQELGADFIFSTNIMLSNNLKLFSKTEFDYIVFDECHHITASTYKKIFEYFDAKFILGLTATPERTDNADVLDMFEQNVPYQLRLRDAIENDLVVPFHYYGIRDEYINYDISKSHKSMIAREVASEENCEFISENIQKHLPTGKLKAIAFCSTISQAELMSERMNEIGYNTTYLTGKNDTGQRISAFNDLQNDSKKLEMIFTVDILNEGVDIPALNMILFLRPTESQIIFTQQLGRGLRKYKDKEYVTILDFIGNNYSTSSQIAFALGALSKNNYVEKQYLKDLVRTDFQSLGLPIEVYLDKLSKEEILSHIEKYNFHKKEILKQDYLNFKAALGVQTYPKAMDYFESGFAPNFITFIKSKIKGKKNSCYYNFLKNIDEPEIPIFMNNEIDFIKKVEEFLPVVRLDEYYIIKKVLNNAQITREELINDERFFEKCNKVSIETTKSALEILLKEKILRKNDDTYQLALDDLSTAFEDYLGDIVDYGINRFLDEFGDYEGDFKLYGNYYSPQIMQIHEGKYYTCMQGTKIYEDSVRIFVNLKKDESTDYLYSYKDKFLSSKVFQWETRNNINFDTPIGSKILSKSKVHLFIRKIKEEDGIVLPYTYFGTGNFSKGITSKNKDAATILASIDLDFEVPKEYRLDFNIKEDENNEAL